MGGGAGGGSKVSDFSFRKGVENTRENLLCSPCLFFGLGKTGLTGDLETDIGWASCTTAEESSSIRSSSEEKLASELVRLRPTFSRSVRMGSTSPFRLSLLEWMS